MNKSSAQPSRQPKKFVVIVVPLLVAALWGVIWVIGAAKPDPLEPTRGVRTVVSLKTVETFSYYGGRLTLYGLAARPHTLGPIEYRQQPPVGGAHDPKWLVCGVYARPVENRLAVHSLEHGATWVTYRPQQLQGQSLTDLQRWANGRRVIVSPYPAQAAAIVVTAWSYQLELKRLDLEAVAAFERDYHAPPEPNAPCF